MTKNLQSEQNSARGTIYKFIITLSGSLLCISFGTMLGWPSPTYPNLLSSDATIPITLDQSAMIAGMLMNGFVISTPFAGLKCIDSKAGVILGALLIFSGWITLYFASNVLALCLSRLCIGLGSGFGLGKFKFYTQELFTPELNQLVTQSLAIFTGVGMVTSFVVGPFVSFRVFPIMAAVIPAVSFVIFIFAPTSPKKLYNQQKIDDAKRIIGKVNSLEYVQEGLENIKKITEKKHWNIFQILRNKYKRKYLLILTFIMTIQQFTGGPALIVYSQIIFTEFGYTYPHLYAIIYAVLVLIFTFIGLKYIHTFNRKPILLMSLFVSTIACVVHVVFLYFKPENDYLTAVPLITMAVYASIHTVGLTIVPSLLVNDCFVASCKYTMNCYANMYTAELAVIVTKIFQVLYGLYGMHVAFSLFSAVGTFGMLVILCCFKETKNVILNN